MDDLEKMPRIPWKPIEPLAPADVPRNGSFAGLDALRQEWERYLSALPETERIKIRQRSLRRLSVETGILERIYEVDWGLTLTLVAEGFTREVIERAGGKVDEHTLQTLLAQRDSLEMVLDFVRADRKLSASFIKELHAALTRTQRTYRVTDMLGRSTECELPHGTWKTHSNHVKRKDGTLLEYAPPEHVPSEIDALIRLYEEIEKRNDVHPVLKATWFHHRFVQIHPFADGNGRVARALTLLVLERHRYAPLVVDRFHRPDYLDALDAANDGNLIALMKLFTRLEMAALTSELERAEGPEVTGYSTDIARTLADQVAALRERKATKIRKALNARAIQVSARMKTWFDAKRTELKSVFAERDVRVSVATLHADSSDQEKVWWFRKEIIDSARTAGHYADFTGYSSWSNLRIRLEGIQLRFAASLHGAGRDVGVMAVTTFGDLSAYSSKPAPSGTSEAAPPQYEPFQTTRDAFLFVHTESTDALDARIPELESLLDSGLTVALSRLLTQV